MFHGLAAYRGGNSPFDIIRKSANLIGNEICTSDRPIGPIGVYVSGTHKRAFVCDVWSSVDHGARLASFDYLAPGTRSTQEEREINITPKLFEHLKFWRDKSRYCELFTVPESIDCVWINQSASPKFKKIARVIARRHGVIVVTVCNDSDALNWV